MFESLHYPNLENPKLVKECTNSYLFSDSLKAKKNTQVAQRKFSQYMPGNTMRACTFINAAIEKEYSIPEFHIDFSKKGSEARLNGLLEVGRLQRFLGG